MSSQTSADSAPVRSSRPRVVAASFPKRRGMIPGRAHDTSAKREAADMLRWLEAENAMLRHQAVALTLEIYTLKEGRIGR